VCSIEGLLVARAGIQLLIQALLSHWRVDLPAGEMMPLPQVKEVLGLEEVLGGNICRRVERPREATTAFAAT
jgi:hypothetical protein